MVRLLKKCTRCNTYTMNPQVCPQCGGPVASANPARFSIEDRYGRYRRAMKQALSEQHKDSE